MRFSYCESLIEKRSFYLFSTEFFYENEFNVLFLRSYGLYKFFYFFSHMLFEFHNSNLNWSRTLLSTGVLRSRNYAKLLLFYFQPHINIKNIYFFNVLRLLNPLNLNGLNLIKALPTRGQRTHSNRKSILRFRNYTSSYILTIPNSDFSYFSDLIRDSSEKIKDIKPEKIKKKKIKTKPKGAKKVKKKKFNVWK